MADIIDFAQRRNATPEMEAGLNKPEEAEEIQLLDVIRLLILTLRDDPDDVFALHCWEAVWDELNPYAEDGHGALPVEVPPEVREAIGKMNRAAFFTWLEGR